MLRTKIKLILPLPISIRYNVPKIHRNYPYKARYSHYDGSIIKPGIRYIKDAEMITNPSQIKARIRSNKQLLKEEKINRW